MDYPKIEHYGSRNVRDIDSIASMIIVQEKLDGSQISFMRTDAGTLRVWSKNRELDLANPDKMFAPAVESLQIRAEKIEPLGLDHVLVFEGGLDGDEPERIVGVFYKGDL